jgi:hypothetical protein
LFKQLVLRAFSRAAASAGRSSAARIAMIAITTSNSINVNADNHARIPRIARPP